MKNTTGSLFKTAEGRNYLWPFVLVTMLFFLWGFAHSILDVLNKHFQDSMHISKTESAYVQAVVYGGYFLMALPAGMIIKKLGYRAGVLCGLGLYGVGALLFIPGGQLMSYPFFLFSLFIIGCGLTCLETAANPYVTVLGSPQGAARRINLSQSFNGLGWICGPLVGTIFLFGNGNDEPDITTPYAIIGVAVVLVAIVFTRVRLPEVKAEEDEPQVARANGSWGALFRHRNFAFGLLALFLYVAAQTGINSFFINYVTENSEISASSAGYVLSFGCMGLFVVGRVSGSWIMSRISSAKVLLFCALCAALSMVVLITCTGTVGVGSFLLCYLCESIMFPTIFALSLHGVGENTKLGSSLLVMCIVGGAVAPLAMGYIGDHIGMSVAFLVPLACFAYVSLYAFMLVMSKTNR